MRRLWLLLCFLCPPLCACSLAPEINHQALDYFQANDLAANQIILLNILRARDGAPLHFSELSQIRGQLSIGASGSATFPFGPLAHATQLPRRLGTLGLTVSSQPSFDVSSLDTKDFTDGVMTPISPQTAEFFFDEGLDYRLVLLLLVSGITPAPAADAATFPQMLLNAPESSRSVCYRIDPSNPQAPPGTATDYRIVPTDTGGGTNVSVALVKFAGLSSPVNSNCKSPYDGYSEPEYFAFLRQINAIKLVYPMPVRTPPHKIGLPFPMGPEDFARNLRAITGIDPTKYRLAAVPSGAGAQMFQLESAAQGNATILCEERPDGSADVVSMLGAGDMTGGSFPAAACNGAPTGDSADDAAAEDDGAAALPDGSRDVMIGVTPGTFQLKLRSTLEVIQYVGQVLAFQQAETLAYPDRPERCITVEARKETATTRSCQAGVLFHLRNTTDTLDFDEVGVGYDGQEWALPPPQVCTDPQGHCDHTLETMSIIALLLNQNKSARDINATPAVQVVP